MIEYLEDAIENDPAEEFPRAVRESGAYVHSTGDPLFDKWAAKTIRGEEVDLGEAFDDPESARQFEAAKAASRARHQRKLGAGLEDAGDEGR